MADKLNLIELMDNFDNSEHISSTFDEKKFEAISKNLETNDKEEAINQIPNKVKNLVKIVAKTVEKLNATIGAKFPNMRQLDLEKAITFNASGVSGKFEIFEVGENQHISFNVKKLSVYPSLEVSAIITKSVIDALAKQNNKENDKQFYNAILLYNEDEFQPKTKEEKEVIKAKNILAGHLRNFLPSIYSDEFEKFVAISDYIAKQIIEELGEKDINKILAPFFDLDALGLKDKAIEKVDSFLGNTHQARLSFLNKKAEDLLLNPETEVLGLSYLEQVESVLGTDTSDPNYSDLSRKFEAMNNGEKCLTGPAVQEFCLAYVHDFLSKRNVADIEVTFNNKGALGSFYDDEHRININLDKLKKIGSYTELAKTLSHELTHTVDSTKSKVAGNDGLVSDISERFRHTSQSEEVNQFLEKLLRISYKVNPNERSARLGEISALMFMTKVGSKDPSIQAEIKKSVASFNRYQKTTIDTIENLPETLAKLNNEFQAFISSGDIVRNSPLCREIEDRFEYISNYGLNANFDEEIKSIEIADLVLNGTQGLEEIRRREQVEIENIQKEKEEKAQIDKDRKEQEIIDEVERSM